MGDSSADKSLLRLFFEVTIAVTAARHADAGVQFCLLDSKHCYSLNSVPNDNMPIGLCSYVLSSGSQKHDELLRCLLDDQVGIG
jgi:hypothetical protein